jgi:flagellar biosynthetic protein FliR
MLVFSRIMGLTLTATFFSSDSFLTEARLGLTFMVTAVIFPVIYQFIPDIPRDFFSYALLAVGEGLIGAAIGFCIDICFSVYQLAGQFFTVQMGFGASEVFDPMSQIELPIIGQYLYILAILVFLSLQGPALIIQAVYHSFELVTFTNFLNGQFIESPYGIVSLFAQMFVVALRISLPIIGTLLLISVCMGLLAKAAPQMNLLMVGFPLSIGVGFIMIIILLPGLTEFIREYIDQMFKNIWNLMLEINHG